MEILMILIPLAIAFALGALVFFIRGVQAGQFDDLETPAHRVLIDEFEENNNDEPSQKV